MRALFIGGGKSGKSTAAQKLAAALADGGPLYYWATMTPHDGEDEERIQRHRDDRAGMGFTTVERSFSLPDGLTAIAPAGTVLFDSVTACLSEQMFPYGGEMDERAGERVLAELLTVSLYPAHFIAVCDDIWRGGEDYRDGTEVYVRALARICRGLAAEFDAVCEMAGGLPRMWKGALSRE